MTHSPTRFLALLLAAVAAVAPADARAQKSEIPVVKPVQDPQGDARQAGLDDEAVAREKELAARGDDEGAGAKPVGPPPLASDLAFHMAPTLGFEPRRIAPGATGTARLVLSMQRESVLAVGTHLEIIYPTEQLGVQFGPWQLGEPQLGAAQGAFRGRPVYENYALVEIPMTVPSSTAFGKYQIRMMVIADITDGRTGNTVRRAQAQVAGDLVVGPPLPTPPAPMGVRGAAGTESGPSAEPIDDGGVAPSVRSGGDPVEAAARQASDAPIEPSANADGTLPVGTDGGSSTTLVLGGAGVVLVLVALLLATRRR